MDTSPSLIIKNYFSKQINKYDNLLTFDQKLSRVLKLNNYRKNINQKSFRERQKIYSAKSTERKKNLEKQINTKYDSKTGQKLFHPSINKNYYNKNKINSNYSLSLDKRNGKLKKEKIKKDIITMIKKEE